LWFHWQLHSQSLHGSRFLLQDHDELDFHSEMEKFRSTNLQNYNFLGGHVKALWREYYLSKNERLLPSILKNLREETDLKKAIKELKTLKIKDPRTLRIAVSVSQRIQGPSASKQLLKDFIRNGHFGDTFEEKMQQFRLNSHALNLEDVNKIYEELRTNRTSQMNQPWGDFAFICVKETFIENLKQFKTDAPEVYLRPFIQASMAMGYLARADVAHLPSNRKVELTITWELLKPLIPLLEDPNNVHIWNAFLSYYILQRDIPMLKRFIFAADLSKLPVEVLMNCLKATSLTDDAERADEILACLKKSKVPVDDSLVLVSHGARDFKKAWDLFNQLPNKKPKDYFRMALAMRVARRPFEERREFIRFMTEKKIVNLRVYFDLLHDYYKPTAEGKTADFLKEILAEITAANLHETFKPDHIGIILNVCYQTNENEIYQQYYEKLVQMDPQDSTVIRWKQFHETRKKENQK
jgi:hypothetical protein